MLGAREGINSLWFLDSAECHTSIGFGCQQMGSGMASPLPLSSAGATHMFHGRRRQVTLSTLVAAVTSGLF